MELDGTPSLPLPSAQCSARAAAVKHRLRSRIGFGYFPKNVLKDAHRDSIGECKRQNDDQHFSDYAPPTSTPWHRRRRAWILDGCLLAFCDDHCQWNERWSQGEKSYSASNCQHQAASRADVENFFARASSCDANLASLGFLTCSCACFTQVVC